MRELRVHTRATARQRLHACMYALFKAQHSTALHEHDHRTYPAYRVELVAVYRKQPEP
jgi:hypothetical protein